MENQRVINILDFTFRQLDKIIAEGKKERQMATDVQNMKGKKRTSYVDREVR